MSQNSTIGPARGKHLLIRADSSAVTFKGRFDLVLTCPPYFHPKNRSTSHGDCPAISDLGEFAVWVAQILLRTSKALKKGGAVCFLKTDIKYKRTLIPVGFRIADQCNALGMRLAGHWVWRRYPFFSPYSPSFVNIFILGDIGPEKMHTSGFFQPIEQSRAKALPTSFLPGIFEVLTRQLTSVGDIVLDPFAGIGSATLAAHRARRWSVGVEISRNQLAQARKVLATIPNIEFQGRNPHSRGGTQ